MAKFDYQLPVGSQNVNVDVVMCIDVTESMQPFLDRALEVASTFYQRVIDGLEKHAKEPHEFRIKIIAFRDMYVDGEYAFEISRFFTLPREVDEYEAFIAGLEAKGGGDEPESALEAFSMAINSEWTAAKGNNRHIVVMITDASAHPLEKRSEGAGIIYELPDGLARSLAELNEAWHMAAAPMTSRSQRFVLFTPNAKPWDILHEWENNAYTGYCPPGDGIPEGGIEAVINSISGSMSS